MKISSIIDIVNGVLQNSPAISFITQSHTKLSKIKDGDLFISSNEDEIKSAVKNGAFAIIYDIPLDISSFNTEIAYIKVASIKDSCIRLLRFELSSSKINCLYCDDISFELFNIYKNSNEILCLSSDDFINYENIMNNNNIKIIISKSQKYISDIYPISCEFKIKHYNLQNLIVHSIFETSFSFNSKYFYKLKLPMIYIDRFISVIEYLNIDNIDTSKLKLFEYLKPIFINKSMKIVEFGKSNMFVLANKHSNISYLEIAFIKKAYSYAKLVVLDSNTLNNNQIYTEISKYNYNALYIQNKSYTEIIELLLLNQKEQIQLF